MSITSDKSDLAIAEKDAGNLLYRKKEFAKALECYDKALQIDATNPTFYLNKAAVYLEQGDHIKCRETCLTAIDVCQTHVANNKIVAKAYSRIGNSFMRQKNFSEAKKFLAKSLLALDSKEIVDKLVQCEKEMKELERLAYINPDASREEKIKGDEALKNGKFKHALGHYSEAIKRNPENSRLYSCRAAVYMRLKNYAQAIEDSKECVEKDPSSVIGHIRLGAALESFCEYEKAVHSYQKALDLDPNAKEATESCHRCLVKDYRYRNSPKLICERANQTEEIKNILSDHEIMQMIEIYKNSPAMFNKKGYSSFLMEKFEKLIRVGLIKVN